MEGRCEYDLRPLLLLGVDLHSRVNQLPEVLQDGWGHPARAFVDSKTWKPELVFSKNVAPAVAFPAKGGVRQSFCLWHIV